MGKINAFLFGVAVGLALGLVMLTTASADILELDSLYIDYKNFAIINDKNRNMLTYPEPAKEGINLGVDTTLLGFVYFNSVVESLTTDAQYRSVGLDTRLGIRLSPFMEFGYYHHSQHVLDRPHSYVPKFLVEDALELKIYLYKARRNTNTLF